MQRLTPDGTVLTDDGTSCGHEGGHRAGLVPAGRGEAVWGLGEGFERCLIRGDEQRCTRNLFQSGRFEDFFAADRGPGVRRHVWKSSFPLQDKDDLKIVGPPIGFP